MFYRHSPSPFQNARNVWEEKSLSLCSSGRMWHHVEKYWDQIRHIQTWFPPERVARRSVCIPLEFLSYIYSALGHGRWFWCLLFISFLCPSSTLPLPLKRHRNTTGTSQRASTSSVSHSHHQILQQEREISLERSTNTVRNDEHRWRWHRWERPGTGVQFFPNSSKKRSHWSG